MTTYDDLVMDLQDWQENPGSEFLKAIPRIIANAESRIYREVDLLVTRKNSSVAINAGEFAFARPSDAYVVRFVKWQDSSAAVGSTILEYYDPNVVEEYAGSGLTVGTPRMCCDYDIDTIRFAPSAATPGTITVAYTYRPDALSSTNQTTWLSLNAANVLLYACLVESAIFLKQRSNNNGEGMKKVYYEKYNEEIALLRAEESRKGGNTYRSGERV